MEGKRITSMPVEAIRGPVRSSRPDEPIATEEPLQIRLNGEPLAVLMRTPQDDLELVAGFLMSEGIVRALEDIATIRACRMNAEADYENVVDVFLSPARQIEHATRVAEDNARRAFTTASSCGVCGKRTIQSLHVEARPFLAPPTVDPELLLRLPEALMRRQETFARTGGLHAAGVFDSRGELLVSREDVGRHNAVDKCVGRLLFDRRLPIEGSTLLVSGRASFEIVQKALLARIQIVAAISAPSSLAVELARASNMCLVGFLRGRGLNVYAGEIETRG